MANPIYHDDPEWYERPGQEVPLIVDVKPSLFVVGEMPGRVTRELPEEDHGPLRPCSVCTRLSRSYLCPYCYRAQHRDECHLARARQPQPSGPRLHGFREGWER